MSTINLSPNRLRLAVALGGVSLLLPACKTEESTQKHTAFPRSENVFAEVSHWYVNPVWSNNASAHGGESIAQHSTAVWLRGLGDVEEVKAGEIPNIFPSERDVGPSQGLDLRDHLNEAELQGNALVQIVLDNVPGEGCGFLMGRAELPPSREGIEAYQTYYIDRIANIVSDYPHIPIAIIVEPYTIKNLVKNSKHTSCQEASNEFSWGYTNAVRYAINTLFQYQNVHMYLDMGAPNHFGWDADIKLTTLFFHGVLNGFDDTMHQEAQSFALEHESNDGATGRYIAIEDVFIEPPALDRGNSLPPGYSKISGFASNVADYVPLEEPYLGDPYLPDGSSPLRSAYFYDWNPRIDELSYTQDWLEVFEGYESGDTDHLGVIIDTSLNGWGQAHQRLLGSGITQNPDEVNDYRIDQREHRKNWCNQPSGIGARPQPTPEGKHRVDAYVWLKPPGESGGPSTWTIEVDPTDLVRWRDPSCDPLALSPEGQEDDSTRDLNLWTGAMDNAPPANQWFAEGFATYLQNAWPQLCRGKGDQC